MHRGRGALHPRARDPGRGGAGGNGRPSGAEKSAAHTATKGAAAAGAGPGQTGGRPWAVEGGRLTASAATAARQAMAQAAIEPTALDLVVVATSSADEITPNAAPLVAGMIGAEGAAAFDVGAACTGWLAGLAMAS